MFQINDVILYSAQGVCKIVAMEQKRIDGANKMFFVLKPINDDSATVFVPTDKEAALKKMRRILTESQIRALLDAAAAERISWITQDSIRKERYRELLAGGDQLALICMIKRIYEHKKQCEEKGKRLHMIDEHFLKDAEQMLFNEFQYVLKLETKEELRACILAGTEVHGISR